MRAGTIVGLTLATGLGIGCTGKRDEQGGRTQAQQSIQTQQQTPSRAYSQWDRTRGQQPPERTRMGSGAAGEEETAASAPANGAQQRGGVADFGLQVPPAHEKQTGIVNGRLAGASKDHIQVRTREGEEMDLQVPAEALVVIEGGVAGVDKLQNLEEGTPVRVVYSIQNGTNVVTNVETTASPSR